MPTKRAKRGANTQRAPPEVPPPHNPRDYNPTMLNAQPPTRRMRALLEYSSPLGHNHWRPETQRGLKAPSR